MEDRNVYVKLLMAGTRNVQDIVRNVTPYAYKRIVQCVQYNQLETICK